MKKQLTICVYGAASNNIDFHFVDKVEELGRELASRGHILIYGGGGCGLMGAVARGVSEENGEIIGVVPDFMNEFEDIYSKCTTTITTKTMAERKKYMEQKADAFIIVPGGIGTMDEFFQILTLIELKRKKAPVIIFNIARFYNSIIDYIDTSIEKGFIQPAVRDLFSVQDSASEVLDAIEEMLF